MGETMDSIRARVQTVRDIQNRRFANGEASGIVGNVYMRVGDISQFCKLQDEGQSLMRTAMSQTNLSVRVYHRIFKNARTIADLAGAKRSHPRIWRRRCNIVPSGC